MNDSSDTKDTVLDKLEYDEAYELLQKYGYNSASTPPYMYQNGDDLGICYSYVDAEYGPLERIKLFEDKESLEEFLKQMKWLETNGPVYHVRMVLDNYETVYPRILFLRNERIMVPGEMDDIETYDFNQEKRASLDDASKLLYEAGDLLIVYDELKARQLAYIQNLTVLKNNLRRKYYELQLEVDKYNRIGRIERHLTLVPEMSDVGIDLTLERTIKDTYNQYIAQRPSMDEVIILLRDVWDMCKKLEKNDIYYQVQIEDNNTRNETKLVEAKLDFMKELNDDVRPLFSIDLMAKFRKINKDFEKKNNSISDKYIKDQLDLVEKKYSFFDQLDLYDVSEYLKEAISNSNYDELARRYAKGRVKIDSKAIRLPLNEVASNLTVQFKENFDQIEQGILVLHNNVKFRSLIDGILQVKDFDTIPLKEVLKALKKVKGFSKAKTECYDIVKKRLEDPINANIKATLFGSFDFTSFDSFVGSMIPILVKLKQMNGKMVLNSDINMYSLVKDPNEIKNQLFSFLTNDINSMYLEAHTNKSMIASVLIKENTPVLYSPYTFDIGDIYSKNASMQMFIKENIGFDLLVENADVDITIEDTRVNVVNYQSSKEVVENLTTAISLDSVYKTTFCRLMFRSMADVQTEQPAVAQPVAAQPVQPAAPVVETAPVVEQSVQPVVPVAPVPVPEKKEEVKPVETKSNDLLIQAINNAPEEKKEEPKVEPVKEEPKVEPVNKEEKKEEVKVEAKPVAAVPTKPVEPAKPAPTVKPAEPVKPVAPAKPVPTSTPTVAKPAVVQKPAEPAKVVQPVQKTVEVKKEEVKPVATAKPVEAAKPAPAVKPPEATKPPVQATKPVEAKPAAPVAKPTVPDAKPAPQPTQTVTKPVQSVAKPATTTVKPVKNVSKPVEVKKEEVKPVSTAKPVETSKPAAQATKPVEAKPAVPVAKPAVPDAKPAPQPTQTVTKPVQSVAKPTTTTVKPVQSVAKPVAQTKPAESEKKEG